MLLKTDHLHNIVHANERRDNEQTVALLSLKRSWSIALSLTLFFVLLLPLQATQRLDSTNIGSIDIVHAEQVAGHFALDKSLSNSALTIALNDYDRGLCIEAGHTVRIYVDSRCVSLQAFIGIDNSIVPHIDSCEFIVVGDVDTLWRSPKLITGRLATYMNVDITGRKSLFLITRSLSSSKNVVPIDFAGLQIVRSFNAAHVTPLADTVTFDSTAVLSSAQDFATLRYNRSTDANTLRVAAKSYDSGLGTHAGSEIEVALAPHCREFRVDVGADDETLPNKASIRFSVLHETDTLWKSGLMSTTNAARLCRLDVANYKTLRLCVDDGGDGTAFDHADWLHPQFLCDRLLPAAFDTILIDKTLISYEQVLYDSVKVNASYLGLPMIIANTTYAHGLGHHAWANIGISYRPNWLTFMADVGVDARSLPEKGSVEFFVIANYRDTLWRSGIMRSGEEAKHCEVSLNGVYQLQLATNNGGDNISYDHCDWANASIIVDQSVSYDKYEFPIQSIPCIDMVIEEVLDYLPRINRSFGNLPIRIGSRQFSSGVGLHAKTTVPLWLNGHARRLHFLAGADRSGLTVGFGIGSVRVRVLGDGDILWQSSVMKTGDEAQVCDIDVSNIHYLEIIADDGDNGVSFDHCSLADGYFTMQYPFAPVQYKAAAAPFVIRTPEDSTPHINGPTMVGTQPGRELLYHIPISGARPMDISISDIPDGLVYDTASHSLRGTLNQRGTYTVTVEAHNLHGQDLRRIGIRVGDTIALSPPMGWNSWLVSHVDIDENNLLEQLRAYRSLPLRDYGYNYFNIDDAWQGQRNAKGEIGWDTTKFPHGLKSLIDSVHASGFLAGLYTSPGVITCAELPGSYNHEEQDVESYCRWGVDALKSDWCATNELLDPKQNISAQMKALHKRMSDAIRRNSRNILLMLDHYDVNAVLEWGQEIGANTWRTGNDGIDTWRNISLDNGFKNSNFAAYVGNGHWNDYDVLTVGNFYVNASGHKHTRLSAAEQYTQMTLWCIGKSLLLMSCDLSTMDPFTLALLCNREVLAIHQDLNPTAGRLVARNSLYQDVWANRMSDSSIAVALFNRDNYATKNVIVRWEDLGLNATTKVRVRDCWRYKDLGVFVGAIELPVGRHDTELLRFYPENHVGVVPENDPTIALRIVPQPVVESPIRVHLTTPFPVSLRFDLFNQLGEKVYQTESMRYEVGDFDLVVPTTLDLSAGLYSLRATWSTGTLSLPFIYLRR